MKTDKAYKLLAQQENLSNSKAKALIDQGLVYIGNKQVVIARGEISPSVTFKIKEVLPPRIIFEDNDILAIDKPAFVTAEELQKRYNKAILLNRLDKETSGVMLFAKNQTFRHKAIQAFKRNQVYKEYIAVVEGKVIEEMEIDSPIVTFKSKGTAKSKIDFLKGKQAKTTLYPLFIEGNKSKIKLIIDTGRTHQIRVHLNSVGFPIIGDTLYGKPSANVKRMLLHSHVCKIFDYTFTAEEPRTFRVFGLQ